MSFLLKIQMRKQILMMEHQFPKSNYIAIYTRILIILLKLRMCVCCVCTILRKKCIFICLFYEIFFFFFFTFTFLLFHRHLIKITSASHTIVICAHSLACGSLENESYNPTATNISKCARVWISNIDKFFAV